VNLAEFLAVRQPLWRELEGLLDEVDRREATSLRPDRARRLVDLYRRTSADLVQARTYGAGLELTAYLEVLVGRGYAVLYQAPPLQAGREVLHFFRHRFPAAVRRERLAFGIVVASFVAGLVLGGVATAIDPEGARLFVPGEHQTQRPRERVEHDEAAARRGERVLDAQGHAAFSSFLFTHNIGVTIVCFAIGLLWGLPTLLLMGYHGVFIAALAVEYIRDGVGLFFFAWILPHGLVELTCMFLGGTAGLMLGRGVLWPRGRPRGERVRQEARAALDILGGTAALLVLAGLVEGTLSQIHEPTLPYPVKIAFAFALAGAVWGYLWLLPVEDDHKAPRTLMSR
jgi:uncharacterized membrane protein SpoIIM required for sporulation